MKHVRKSESKNQKIVTGCVMAVEGFVRGDVCMRHLVLRHSLIEAFVADDGSWSGGWLCAARCQYRVQPMLMVNVVWQGMMR